MFYLRLVSVRNSCKSQQLLYFSKIDHKLVKISIQEIGFLQNIGMSFLEYQD